MRYPGILERAAVAMMAALAIAVPPHVAFAGPGEAAGRPRSASTSGPDLAGIDYVVIVWYRRNDPLGTFQYQTYDVRKGEYTDAVDAWLKLMQEKYPSYLVKVRKVDLERERGETEQLRVGSVIHRELLVAAAESGVILGGPLRIGPGPYATPSRAPRTNVWAELPGAGGQTNINPVQGTSPFPVPYPRPHP
jgi:hypothetical protein